MRCYPRGGWKTPANSTDGGTVTWISTVSLLLGDCITSAAVPGGAITKLPMLQGEVQSGAHPCGQQLPGLCSESLSAL